MKLIARSNIIGIKDDEGLRALNGIEYFEAETKNEIDLIERFFVSSPMFRADSIEIIQ